LDKQRSICIGEDTFLSEETSEMLLKDLENKFEDKFDVRDAEKYIKDNRLELVIKRPNTDVSFPHLSIYVKPNEYWLAQRKDSGDYKFFHELYLGENNEVARQFLDNERDDKMNEWLTTGEMIDELRVGEKAEVVKIEGGVSVNVVGNQVERTEHQIVWEDNQSILTVNDFTLSLKWVIVPDYVSFDEAKEALKSGKTVTCEYGNGKAYSFTESDSIHSVASSLPLMSWGTFLNAKWIIED